MKPGFNSQWVPEGFRGNSNEGESQATGNPIDRIKYPEQFGLTLDEARAELNALIETEEKLRERYRDRGLRNTKTSDENIAYYRGLMEKLFPSPEESPEQSESVG